MELKTHLNKKKKNHAEIIYFVTLSIKVTLLKQDAVFGGRQSWDSMDVMDISPFKYWIIKNKYIVGN